jgi:hypothetical protein
MSIPVLLTTLLNARGEIRRAQVKMAEDSTLTLDLLQSYFRKKTAPSIIGYYQDGSLLIFICGYKEGKTGSENKCSLPAPYENTVLYGDALIIVSDNVIAASDAWKKPTVYLPTNWEDFTGRAAGIRRPLDDVNSESSDEDEEEEGLGEIEEEEVDGALSEEEANSIIEVEEEEVPQPVRRKKKAAPSHAMSGYEKQNILLMAQSQNELSLTTDASSYPKRCQCIERFNFLSEHAGMKPDQIAELEKDQQNINDPVLLNGIIANKVLLKTILSSATILPVEESWNQFNMSNKSLTLENKKIWYPQGVIIQSK